MTAPITTSTPAPQPHPGILNLFYWRLQAFQECGPSQPQVCVIGYEDHAALLGYLTATANHRNDSPNHQPTKVAGIVIYKSTVHSRGFWFGATE